MSESMKIKSWIFINNGIAYWEWRNAYRKLLEYIIKLREQKTRIHYDSDCVYESDKHYVRECKKAIEVYDK